MRSSARQLLGRLVGVQSLVRLLMGTGPDEREEDRGDLDGEGDFGKVAGEDTEMFEGQQEKQVQQGGGGHPEWHNLAE